MRARTVRRYTDEEIAKAEQRRAAAEQRKADKHAEGCTATKSGWPFCSYCGRDVRTPR